MEKTKTRPDSDCYYYYYSSCSKGNSCPYRHEPAALKRETVCTFWLKGRCSTPHCTFRHMYLSKDRSKIPCFYESQPSGCEKPHCPYLHKLDLNSSKLATNTPNELNLPLGNGKSFEKGKPNYHESVGYERQGLSSVQTSDRVFSSHCKEKSALGGTISRQNLTGSTVSVPPYDGHQTSNYLTGPYLAKCLSEFDGCEATLLTLFRDFRYQPEFVERLILINGLSFELVGESVRLRPKVEICLSHIKATGCQISSSCYFIHICLKYLIGDCFDRNCTYGHQWHTNHNNKVLKEFNLTLLSADRLTHLFNTVIIPNYTKNKLWVCKNYNEGKCQDSECYLLHLCLDFLAQKCSSDGICKLSHDIQDNKVELILNLHGISTNESPRNVLLKIINIPSVKHSIKSLGKEGSMKDNILIDTHKISNPNKSNVDVELPKTKWAHDLDGNIKINEICFDSVESYCPYEESGCNKLHCIYHFYWQVKVQVGSSYTWYNFSEKQAISLEKAFCNPSCVKTDLPLLDPSCSKKGLLAVLKGRSLWEADFKKMIINLVDGKEILGIRRLCSNACRFKWYFLDIYNNWTEYGCKDSFGDQQHISTIDSIFIEYFYGNRTSVDFNVGKCKYTLFFKDMSQKNLQTGIVRKVRRRPGLLLKSDDSETDLPPSWEPMQTEERCRRITLQPSSEEYKKIENLIQSRANGNVFRILKIERIQNPFAYKAFQIKVQQMKVIYKNDAVIDIRQLFHGTAADIVPKICDENFDWRLHGTTNGQAYGRGTYFAVQSSYSYKYAKEDVNRHRFIFVVKVAVGTKTQGNSGITRPPINIQYNLPYDSTVDNVSNPSIIVKYERQEYYPEYLVTMK